MPILWRYLLSHYLKVLLFCVASFIAVLLTTRLQEIAHFASLGPQASYIFWFALYQIPYILPIAIPVSSLISSMILVQRLSVTHELTALRASGIALRNAFAPLLLAAACMAFLNFYIISELATHAHLKTRMLEQELRSINPLLLLENKQLSKFKGLYVNSMGPSKLGESASHLVIALQNKKSKRLNVMLAQNIRTADFQLIGEDVTILNSMGKGQRDQFDHLIVENMKKSETSVEDFSQLIRKQSGAKVNTDYLTLSMLLLRIQEDLFGLNNAQDEDDHQFYKRRTVRNTTELLRRISLSLAVLTFTLMGATFGISISRKKSLTGVIWVVSLAALFLVCYFIAKGMESRLIPSSTLYMVPHLLIIGCSLRVLNRISHGIEQ